MKSGRNKFCVMSLSPTSMQQRMARHNAIQLLIGWLALLGSGIATVATFWLFRALWLMTASFFITDPWSGVGWVCGLVGTGLIFWAGWRQAHREEPAYYETDNSSLGPAFGSAFWIDLEMTFLMIALVVLYRSLLLAPLLYVTARRRFQKSIVPQRGKAERLCALWGNLVSQGKWQSMTDFASCVEDIHDLIDIGMLEYSSRTRRFKPAIARIEELGMDSEPSLPNFTTTDPGNPRSGSDARP